MVDIKKLKGIIAENDETQKSVANAIGVTPKTFYLKMKKGVFGTDEIEKMIEFLNIDNPMPIFFAK